jgi:hypothetical protein
MCGAVLGKCDLRRNKIIFIVCGNVGIAENIYTEDQTLRRLHRKSVLIGQ